MWIIWIKKYSKAAGWVAVAVAALVAAAQYGAQGARCETLHTENQRLQAQLEALGNVNQLDDAAVRERLRKHWTRE